jgi:hypothetical protein
MRKVSRQNSWCCFSQVEWLPQQGERAEISRYKHVFCDYCWYGCPSTSRPDFLARLRCIYGSKMLKVSGAQLLAQERERD